LTYRESQAVLGAISYVLGRGYPALPVHDSLIVPESAEAFAREGLTGAFKGLVGLVPKLKVNRADG
jgi:hypothetical protein